MRGDSVPTLTHLDMNEIAYESVVVKKGRKIATAHIINPETNQIEFHVVSTWWAKAAIAGIVTLILCGILVLGMVLYNKSEIDTLRRELKVDEPR